MPLVDVREGDVITAVDGVGTLAPEHIQLLLRDAVGKDVRLRVLAGDTGKRPRRRRAADLVAARRRAALPRLGTRSSSARRRCVWRVDWLRPPAGDERRGHVGVAARLLPGARPAGADHRPAPQHRRQHRQLAPQPAAAPGVVLLAAAQRSADGQHALRVSRPHRGAGGSGDGLGRRGLRRGRAASRPRRGHRHTHLGRRDLGVGWQRAARSRHGVGARHRRLQSAGRVAHRRTRRRAGHGRGQPAGAPPSAAGTPSWMRRWRTCSSVSAKPRPRRLPHPGIPTSDCRPR